MLICEFFLFEFSCWKKQEHWEFQVGDITFVLAESLGFSCGSHVSQCKYHPFFGLLVLGTFFGVDVFLFSLRRTFFLFLPRDHEKFVNRLQSPGPMASAGAWRGRWPWPMRWEERQPSFCGNKKGLWDLSEMFLEAFYMFLGMNLGVHKYGIKWCL